MMKMKLDGKYAVVNGAAKEIGEAIARRFYEDGAAGVAVLDIDQEISENVAKNIDPSIRLVFGFACEVVNRLQVEEVLGKIKERFNGIDILVNNAGITQDSIIHKMKVEQWDEVLKVNLSEVSAAKL